MRMLRQRCRLQRFFIHSIAAVLFFFCQRVHADQVFEGTCDQFNNYVMTQGVQVEPDSPLNSTEDKTSGLAGITYCKYETNWVNKITIKDDEFCAQHLSNSPFTLTPSVSIVIVRWKPTTVVSGACRQEIGRYYAQVQKHEEKHKRDCLEVLARWAKAYRPKEQTLCAQTEEEAKAQINEMIVTELKEKAYQPIHEELTAKAQVFHQSKQGGPVLLINCSLCHE